MPKRALPLVLALCAASVTAQPAAPQGESEVQERLPIPWHSPQLYAPKNMIDPDASESTLGGVDSGAMPGEHGIVNPYQMREGQFIILRPPQPAVQPQSPAAPATPVQQEQINQLRPQQQLPQYGLQESNPAHAAILKARASGDVAAALSAARQLSGQGDIAATRFVASQYQYGGAGYDLSQWLRWVDVAAQQGDTLAQLELGRVYAGGVPAEASGTGQAVAADAYKAMQYLQMCWRVSNDCAYGLGAVSLQVGQPYGAVYMRHAAGAAHPKAMLWLGRALVDGAHGQPRDPVMGAAWLKLAASSGVQEAVGAYGEVYNGLNDVQRKNVDASVQQLQERFSKGGVVRKRHAKKKEPEGLIGTILEAMFQDKVAKPLNQRLGAAPATQ